MKEVAEVEDLLPVSAIEAFLLEEDVQPELVILAPTGVRYVIGEGDKRALANWVVDNCEREQVPELSALLAKALKHFGITV